MVRVYYSCQFCVMWKFILFSLLLVQCARSYVDEDFEIFPEIIKQQAFAEIIGSYYAYDPFHREGRESKYFSEKPAYTAGYPVKEDDSPLYKAAYKPSYKAPVYKAPVYEAPPVYKPTSVYEAPPTYKSPIYEPPPVYKAPTSYDAAPIYPPATEDYPPVSFRSNVNDLYPKKTLSFEELKDFYDEEYPMYPPYPEKKRYVPKYVPRYGAEIKKSYDSTDYRKRSYPKERSYRTYHRNTYKPDSIYDNIHRNLQNPSDQRSRK